MYHCLQNWKKTLVANLLVNESVAYVRHLLNHKACTAPHPEEIRSYRSLPTSPLCAVTSLVRGDVTFVRGDVGSTVQLWTTIVPIKMASCAWLIQSGN
jgi:hypothetical protein